MASFGSRPATHSLVQSGRQAHTIFNVGRGHAHFGPKRARTTPPLQRVLATENVRLMTGVQTKDNAEIEITFSGSNPFMSEQCGEPINEAH